MGGQARALAHLGGAPAATMLSSITCQERDLGSCCYPTLARTGAKFKSLFETDLLRICGVRVFEGINFLSRDRELSPARLDAFYARAEKAGLAPYGARRDQMHVVEHAPAGFKDVDNWWQSFWTAIGVDKLLAPDAPVVASTQLVRGRASGEIRVSLNLTMRHLAAGIRRLPGFRAVL